MPPLSPALKAVSDAVLAVTSERAVEEVLQRLVESARELASARYAALGLPDGEEGFSQFLTAGMSDELVAAMGPLPRRHGLLGLMLEAPEPFRTSDIHGHPRFRGWWPRAHPDMRSFLGVPIVAPEGVIGAFYLTEKEGADDFSATDQEVIELLAAHAAIAITNARLYERSRELSILAERNRLALELHDAVSQKLFSLVLTAEAAGTLLDRDADARARAGGQGAGVGALGAGRAALADLRAAPSRSGARRPVRGAAQARRGRAPVAAAGDRARPRGRPGRGARTGGEILRIAQEALANALRHAEAEHVWVRLGAEDGRLVLEVRDDGVGFDPDAAAVRSRRLGLTSMEERAQRLGGRLTLRSEPGAGTTVRLEAARA